MHNDYVKSPDVFTHKLFVSKTTAFKTRGFFHFTCLAIITSLQLACNKDCITRDAVLLKATCNCNKIYSSVYTRNIVTILTYMYRTAVFYDTTCFIHGCSHN